MQKRFVRKRDLEIALSKIEAHPSPRAYLEQYTIPSNVAANLLSIAAYMHDDITKKFIADLGCGTGRLALGAVLLGAEETVGVDIDRAAVRIAKESAEELKLMEKTHWIVGDVDVLHGNFHTVLQNPPFGVQKRGADRIFLTKALELAPVVYSLHKSGEGNRVFIKRFIEGHGGRVTGIFPMKLNIPKLFKFHTQRKHVVEVDLYRIVRRT